jgi:hypothetical protein
VKLDGIFSSETNTGIVDETELLADSVDAIVGDVVGVNPRLEVGNGV